MGQGNLVTSDLLLFQLEEDDTYSEDKINFWLSVRSASAFFVMSYIHATMGDEKLWYSKMTD